jgi:MoaA/NifB/PqqE/SkfB family radical SAM enzyme
VHNTYFEEDNKMEQGTERLTWASAKAPVFVSLELTGRCNLRCRHCYAAGAPEQLAGRGYDKNAGIIKELANSFDAVSVNMKGGEPTSEPYLLRLIGDCIDRGLHVGLTTNATLLTRSLAFELKELGVRNNVYISIDGSSAFTNDSIRGRGSFAKAIRGTDALGHAGVRFAITSVVGKWNLFDVPNMALMAESVGARLFHLVRFAAKGRGANLLQEELSVAEFADAASAAAAYLRPIRTIYDDAVLFSTIPDEKPMFYQDSLTSKGLPSAFSIRWTDQLELECLARPLGDVSVGPVSKLIRMARTEPHVLREYQRWQAQKSLDGKRFLQLLDFNCPAAMEVED